MQKCNRRSTKVCTRCRQRKTKCDFKYPQCTSCEMAGVACLGFDPRTRQAVPRSLVRALEAQVAKLEAQVLALRSAPENMPCLMASKIAEATISFGVSNSGSYLRSKVSPALFFRPSCPPLALTANSRDVGPGHTKFLDYSAVWRGLDRSGKLSSTSNPIDITSIPEPALERMVRNYSDIHLPQYPCISESVLMSIVERALREEPRDINTLPAYSSPTTFDLGHFEYFVLFIVLAISAITLTWKAEHQARSASESFYKSALRHLQLFEDYSEIRGLQISLLLAHYAHMCPEKVDNWTCIANAMRIVLNLGLYKESPDRIDPDRSKVRHDLFWVTYGMERSLCANLRLPLSLPEEVISIKLDNKSSPEVDSQSAIEDAKKSSGNHIIRYRMLETEVHRVLYLGEDLPGFNGFPIQNWVSDITRRLEAWYENAQVYTPYEMLEFKHVQFHHLKARIHRPTPRLRNKTVDDWAIVLYCCRKLIEDYMGQKLRKRLFYPWHGTHILYEIIVIALDASWSSRDYQDLTAQAMQMVYTLIPQCLQLLDGIGQRWNEATRCANKLKPLADKIISALSLANKPQSLYISISQEIHSLVFPDKSPIWESPTLRGNDFGFQVESLPNDTLLGHDMGFLQWAPEWDIMPSDLTSENESPGC